VAAERLSMRTIREILRLKWDCQRSNREIAQSCHIARSSVAECLSRAAAAGLTWPLPPELDDGTLEARLYRRPGRPPGQQLLPDWAIVHQELCHPGVSPATCPVILSRAAPSSKGRVCAVGFPDVAFRGQDGGR